MAVQLLRHRFTIEEYHRMGQAGILAEDARVELIEGEVVEMVPIGSHHAACVARLTHVFTLSLGNRVIVWVQSPVRLVPHSEPQPDLTLLRARPDFYAKAHPGPEDVLLLVEVADTTADLDRNVKVPLYAQARIPEVWLVDLTGECIEVFRRPTPQGYRDISQARRGQRLTLEAFPNLNLPADDLLGPAD